MKKKEDQDRKKDKALIEMVYKMALKSLIPEDVELRQFKELNRWVHINYINESVLMLQIGK